MTAKSGVRIQAELEGPKTIAMRHNWCTEEGYFVCAKVETLPLSFLMETGWNVSILNKHVLNQLSSEVCQSVQPTKTKLLSVTGEITPFLGKAVLNIEIGFQTLTQKFLFADIENEGILGMDFLTAHQCDLMLTQGYLKIKERENQVFCK